MATATTEPKAKRAKKPATLSAARLRDVLAYDAGSGVFTWRISRGPAVEGAAAGSRTAHGYIIISVDCARYYGHRLAWLYEHGRWPADQLDHINGDGTDNRIVNLRECSNAENCQNLGIRINNTSGATGVHWSASRSKWVAQIRKSGRIVPLGRFATREAAHAAFLAAKAASHTSQPVPRGL